MKLPPAVCIPSELSYKTHVNNGSDFIEISAPDGQFSCSVTVDLKRRSFRTGYSFTGPTATTAAYAGRGWCERMFADAVAYLQDAIGKAV